MVSARLETARRFIGMFETLDTHTLDSILAEKHVHEFAPASLGTGTPYDKQGMIEHIDRLHDILDGFPVFAKEYVESEDSNRVTVWATSRTIFRDDARDDEISPDEWAYEGEYIFIFSMNETGDKIVRTVEFLDSKATADKLRPLMKRARKNKEKRL
ncbi:MAG: hypothetical protein M1822_001071 [Bathelium mastoideum]|nr:MAG: hypothetical protein M1822_001071 [Bathelium mastoideum]